MVVLGDIAVLQGGPSHIKKSSSQAQVPREAFRGQWMNGEMSAGSGLALTSGEASPQRCYGGTRHGKAAVPPRFSEMVRLQLSAALCSTGTEAVLAMQALHPAQSSLCLSARKKALETQEKRAMKDTDKHCRTAGLL